MIHRQATFQKQPVWTKRNHPPICHSEGVKRSRGIYSSGKIYLVLVHPPTWWIPPLRYATVGMTFVFGFGRYKFECTTIPAPGGRMAADCRRYTRYIQQTTQCSGDDSSPSNVSKTTCVDKTEPPPDMSFRGSAAGRGIYSSGNLYLVLVHPPTWWIPPLRYGRNDIRFWVWSLQI